MHVTPLILGSGFKEVVNWQDHVPVVHQIKRCVVSGFADIEANGS